MLKSSKTRHYVLHFSVAFVLVWPALVLFYGPTLIHQYSELTDRCDHYGLALYNAMFDTGKVDTSAFVIGRQGFIDAMNSEAGLAQISALTQADNFVNIETTYLNLVAVAQFVSYLDDRNVAAIFIESNPAIWTDYGTQKARRQEHLRLLEAEMSPERLYDTLRVLFNLIESGCQVKAVPQLPDDIRSASFILNFESIHAEARDTLRQRSQSTPVYWVHDESYYAESLRGSADTLDSLRQLPEQYDKLFGSFSPFPVNSN